MAAVEQLLDPPAPVDAEAAPALADDAHQREAGMNETSLVGRVRAWLPEGFHPPQLRIVARLPSAEVMMIRPLSERGTPDRELTEKDVFYWRADMF